MPRYYFDVNEGETTILEDPEGVELDGIEAALIKAQSALAGMVRDKIPIDGTRRVRLIVVRDGTGQTVLRAGVSLIVEIQPEAPHVNPIREQMALGPSVRRRH
jgi:uncharacterized protein DUF6894